MLDMHDDLDSMLPIAIVSGGFDPIHAGHLDLIEGAARLGRVLVILNSDEWLTRKKGKPFMIWEERARILRAVRWVQGVIAVDDSDGSVCEALLRIKTEFTYPNWSPPLIFCNGGDRKVTNTPEQSLCGELGMSLAWYVGGGKVQSSSTLLQQWNS